MYVYVSIYIYELTCGNVSMSIYVMNKRKIYQNYEIIVEISQKM